MATETMPQAAVESPAPPPPAPTNGQALTKPAAPLRERIQVHYDPTDPAALYMDTGQFEQLQRVAQVMARSSLVPEHLRYHPTDNERIKEQRIADCFLVVGQAIRWRMDCFAAAQHTIVVKGKLGYEGKLIAAMINASGKVEKNLTFQYSGSGPGRKVVVSATLKGEKEPRTVEGTVDQWATDNEMWRKDPDQILAYRGSRQWGRRHTPEIMLGIYADEELPAMTAGTVQMERTPSGAFQDKRATPPRDALLEAVGIVEVPAEIVLVDPKECSHPGLPPSALKPGASAVCTKCGEEVTAPVEG